MNADDDEEEDGDEAAHGSGGGGANGVVNGSVRRNELPQYYQPEPFMVPDPTLGRDSYSFTNTNTGVDDVEARRPLSGAPSSYFTRATTPDAYGVGGSAVSGSAGYERRKGGPPRQMRPVNIIQHDDAGPSLPSPEGEKDEEPVTIELPPAYTALGRGGGVGVGEGAGASAEAGAAAGAGH